MAVLPLFIHGVLGYSTTIVGAVVGTQSLATLLSRPHAGTFTDRAGPRQAIAWGLAACSVSGLALAAAASERTGALGSLVLGRLALGVGESLLITGALALAIRRVGQWRSGLAIVWVGLALFGAYALGAPAGQAAFSASGLAPVAGAVVAAPLIGLLLASRMARVTPMPLRRVPMTTVLRWVAPAGAALALSAIGYAAIVSFLPLLMEARDWGNAGLALGAFAAGFILARVVFASWPDRHGHRRVAIGFLAIEAIGLLLLWLAPTGMVAELGAALTGAGYSIAFPALGIEAIRSVPSENRGVALGTWAAFLDFGLGVGAPLLGVIAGLAGLQAPFGVGVLGCGAAIAIILSLGR